MAMIRNGKIYRNVPEQVEKNKKDIEALNSEVDIIKDGISSAYKIQGSSSVADLNSLEKTAAKNGFVYNITDSGSLTNEDSSTITVQVGDNVVLVWNEGEWYWDRLTGIVDTSNLVTLDTDQTITGKKTFNNSIYLPTTGGFIVCGNSNEIQINQNETKFDGKVRPWSGNTFDLGDSLYTWKDLYLSGKSYFSNPNALATFKLYENDYGRIRLESSVSGVNTERFEIHPTTNFIINSNVFPRGNNNWDLGTSTQAWKDLYLAGKIAGSGTSNLDIENGSLVFRIQPNGFASCNYLIPISNSGGDLGISSNKWRDIYLARNLTDGTNSVTVSQIGTKLYLHELDVEDDNDDNYYINLVLSDNATIQSVQDLLDAWGDYFVCMQTTCDYGNDEPILGVYAWQGTNLMAYKPSGAVEIVNIIGDSVKALN